MGIGLGVGIGVLAVGVDDGDGEVFLKAVAGRRFQEEVGRGFRAGSPEHDGPILGVRRVEPPARRALVGLTGHGDLLDLRRSQVEEREVQVADAVLLRIDLGDLWWAASFPAAGRGRRRSRRSSWRPVSGSCRPSSHSGRAG